MQTFRVAPQLCPHCGYAFDAASTVQGEGDPEPGALSICISCGETMVIDDALRLRIMTPEERAKIDPKTRGLLAEAKRFTLLRNLSGVILAGTRGGRA